MKKSIYNAHKRGVLYDGPVLLLGDFNTWCDGLAEVVETIIEGLGLMPLEYEVDYRKRWFGQTLDHIFVRCLLTVRATSIAMASSDHNPLAVPFSYRQLPRGIKVTP